MSVEALGSLKTSLWEVGRIAGPYFRSEERWSAIGLSVSIIAAQLSLVGAAVAENYWRNAFFQTLQDRDWNGFLTQFGFYSIIGIVFVLATVYQRYLTQWLTINWRRWLTARYVGEWLDGPVHYRASLARDPVDNPDQRIADDVRQFIDGVISLTTGLIGAVARVVSFVAILWTLSNLAPLRIFGEPYVIPGYMVWAAVIYAGLGTTVTHLIGRHLVAIDFERERREANFRFALVRVREHSEAVAMMRGEASEREDLLARFSDIVTNWWRLMRREQFVSLFAESYRYYSRYIPYFALSPLFFGGSMQIGAFMQAGSAFNSVHQGFSYFIGSYARIAELAATVRRLSQFETAMRAAQQADDGTRPSAEKTLDVDDLTVSDAAGRVLVSLDSLTLAAGETMLLVGPSGEGKTSLLRALAGIWPHTAGRVARFDGRIMGLPQRPYIPLGSLRRALCYPSMTTEISDGRLREIMSVVGLSRLVSSLDIVDGWDRRLSEGEKQRLSLARVLLAEPDLILLDEPTSAIEESVGAALYQELRRRLPRSTIVSSAHQENSGALHDKIVQVQRVA